MDNEKLIIEKEKTLNFFLNNYKKDNISSSKFIKKTFDKLSELTVKGLALTDDQKINLQELLDNPKSEEYNFRFIFSILTYGQILWTGWCYPIRL